MAPLVRSAGDAPGVSQTTLIIIGVVVGIAIVVAIILITVLILRKRQRHIREIQSLEDQQELKQPFVPRRAKRSQPWSVLGCCGSTSRSSQRESLNTPHTSLASFKRAQKPQRPVISSPISRAEDDDPEGLFANVEQATTPHHSYHSNDPASTPSHCRAQSTTSVEKKHQRHPVRIHHKSEGDVRVTNDLALIVEDSRWRQDQHVQPSYNWVEEVHRGEDGNRIRRMPQPAPRQPVLVHPAYRSANGARFPARSDSRKESKGPASVQVHQIQEENTDRSLSVSEQIRTDYIDARAYLWDAPFSKPSAMKGSPNARPGQRKQTGVRISTQSPRILGQSQSRSNSPVRNDEEDDDGFSAAPATLSSPISVRSHRRGSSRHGSQRSIVDSSLVSPDGETRNDSMSSYRFPSRTSNTPSQRGARQRSLSPTFANPSGFIDSPGSPALMKFALSSSPPGLSPSSDSAQSSLGHRKSNSDVPSSPLLPASLKEIYNPAWQLSAVVFPGDVRNASQSDWKSPDLVGPMLDADAVAGAIRSTEEDSVHAREEEQLKPSAERLETPPPSPKFAPEGFSDFLEGRDLTHPVCERPSPILTGLKEAVKTPALQGPRAVPARSMLMNAVALRRMDSQIDHSREAQRFARLGRAPSPVLPFTCEDIVNEYRDPVAPGTHEDSGAFPEEDRAHSERCDVDDGTDYPDRSPRTTWESPSHPTLMEGWQDHRPRTPPRKEKKTPAHNRLPAPKGILKTPPPPRYHAPFSESPRSFYDANGFLKT